jgi:hypothetical protein
VNISTNFAREVAAFFVLRLFNGTVSTAVVNIG